MNKIEVKNHGYSCLASEIIHKPKLEGRGWLARDCRASLIKIGARYLFARARKFGKLRRNLFARPAPSSKEVHNHQLKWRN